MDVRLLDEDFVADRRIGNDSLLAEILQTTFGSVQRLADFFLSQSLVGLMRPAQRPEALYTLADAMEQGLQKAKAALGREPVEKVNIGGDHSGEDADTAEGDGTRSNGKQVIIQKLIMQVDLKKIKDLQMLLSLLKEVEDYSEGNGDNDPDATPSPA